MREIEPTTAARTLVGHLGLAATTPEPGAAGVRAVLARLRCIQLDPLDRIGTNADLVALARVDGTRAGEVYDHLLGGRGFEHFAKERCLLPAYAFPYYRDRATQNRWWRLSERLKRIDERTLDAVLDEVRRRGPVTAAELTDRGRVEPLDYSGWKSTAKTSTMALGVLWTRCQVVVCGRRGRHKVYDVPERALPDHCDRPTEHGFARWALLERIEAAGLLSTATGPQWGMLRQARDAGLADELVAEGLVERVTIRGSRRVYLVPAGLFDRRHPDDDGRMRILGPLDPLLWDRKLVAHAFGFDYIWEVYKPADKRRWGYYVCPLLHRGRLVGRFEAHTEADGIVVDRLWVEDGVAFDERAFQAALDRHAALITSS